MWSTEQRKLGGRHGASSLAKFLAKSQKAWMDKVCIDLNELYEGKLEKAVPACCLLTVLGIC